MINATQFSLAKVFSALNIVEVCGVEFKAIKGSQFIPKFSQ